MSKRVLDRVAIIMPAFNESEVISETLRNIKKELKKLDEIKTDLIVVNDGSSDETYELAKKYSTVLNHLVNMGSGAATRTGLEYAKRNKYKYAVTIDADGQHAPKDLVKIINKLLNSKFDLVVGSRMLKPGKMPINRKFGNNLLSIMTTIFMGVKVSDSQSGLKGFSRKAIEKIDIKTNGFEFCSEILWKAGRANLKIVEIPINAIYTTYSLGKGQTSINALRIIKSIITQKLRDV